MQYIIGEKWSFFEKIHFFCKIFLKSLPVQKKCVSLHRQTKTRVWYSKIGIWCNGNTTDSGPVIPGSSPGIPTRSFSIEGLFFSPKYPNVSADFWNRVLSWLFFYIRKGNKDWIFNPRSLFCYLIPALSEPKSSALSAQSPASDCLPCGWCPKSASCPS